MTDTGIGMSSAQTEDHEPAAATLLAIDDDPTALELIGRYLGKEHFRILKAASGKEGLSLAKERHPDVITLDVFMPDLNGWDVLSMLKSDEKLADIPVVMLTILDNKSRMFSLGASDYLTEPINRRRLIEVLSKYKKGAGSRVLILMEDIEPEVVLLDLMMPEMDGFQFIDELRRTPAWRLIPIIVVTAKDLTDEDRKHLNGYVEGILEKGAYNGEDLLKEVRRELLAAVQNRKPAP